MNTALIAISGKLKHGKDTLAKYIKAEISHHIMNKSYSFYYEHSGSVVETISFSDPIKEAVWKMFPDLTKDDLWGISQNRSKPIKGYINPLTGNELTIRDCLTSIGAWGRSCNENCWVDATMKKARISKKRGRTVIITDCRYKNEKAAIEAAGGKVIRVIRPDVGFTTNDPSEIDLDDVPLDQYYKVVINSSLDDLKNQAIEISNDILKELQII